MENRKDRLKNAICNNDIDFFKKHKEQYSINERFEDEEGDTLLLYSISFPNSTIYDFFLNNGAEIELKNDEGEGILHAIVYSGIKDRLVEFLANYSVDLNTVTNEGVTPLLLSIALNHFDMAYVLLQHGADATIGDLDGVTPLHIAVQHTDVDLVKYLVEKGADLWAKTAKGNYPLALAVNAKQEEVVRFLYPLFYE